MTPSVSLIGIVNLQVLVSTKCYPKLPVWWATYVRKTVNASKLNSRLRRSKFAYDRRKLIRIRGRIANRISSHPRKNNSSLIAEVKQIDSDICDSHHNEHLFEEHEATSKVASQPQVIS